MANGETITKDGQLRGFGVFITPEGLIMLPIAIIFDLATFICAVLILFYGIGYLAGLIVDAVSLCIFIPWSIIRSQFKKAMSVETEEGSEEQIEVSPPEQLQKPEIAKEEEAKAVKGEEEATKEAKMVREEEEAVKVARGGEEAARIARAGAVASRAAKFAKWGKILTPIKNAVPFLGLIPTWTPTVYFELQT